MRNHRTGAQLFRCSTRVRIDPVNRAYDDEQQNNRLKHSHGLDDGEISDVRPYMYGEILE